MTTPAAPPMTSSFSRTTVTCTKCGKQATVPFVPTPGRPVFCRECFATAPGAGAPRGPRPAFHGPPGRADVPDRPRKRMMAQGRKGHFMHDAKAALMANAGGMEDKDVRAFLEGLFARGARGSTEAAQEFLDEKATGTLITADQRVALGRLVEKYSFYR
ncbi:MAG TPA: CxxC-x17-CxxC domain-containing protein [Candidatus Thermoplasmatota archaeon]|nr:CxxC-x17-CxxC domain-containing protein [Candidatus Thermoplasmatota archaeon]